MPTRRRIDWIQFGILLCTLLGLIAQNYVGRGRLEQKVDDQQTSIEELKQSIRDLDQKVENKALLLGQKIEDLEIKKKLASP